MIWLNLFCSYSTYGMSTRNTTRNTILLCFSWNVTRNTLTTYFLKRHTIFYACYALQFNKVDTDFCFSLLLRIVLRVAFLPWEIPNSFGKFKQTKSRQLDFVRVIKDRAYINLLISEHNLVISYEYLKITRIIISFFKKYLV